MAYRYILFDLDGTLTNPAEGLYNSVYYALERMDRDRPPSEKMSAFIGPPLVEGFATVCGMTEEEAVRARDLFREYYPVKGIYECRMYDGIPAMLASLIACGYRLVLATSKPEIFARRLLDHYDLSKYFTYVAGSLLDESRSQKHEVITYAMDSVGIADPATCLMVGDRRYDVEGARLCGMDAVGVLWGHGSEGELREAGACALVSAPEELIATLERLSAG
jgi:phosphoglycolate phosphatase